MHRRAESALLLAASSLGAGLLTACTAMAPAASGPTPLPAPVTTVQAVPAAAAPPPQPESVPASPVLELLTYADKLSKLAAAELDAELESLRKRQGAGAWLQASLVHAHKQPPDLQRAIELSSQSLGDTSPEGQQLQPLARLLASRYAQQRRLEEQVDKQGKQLVELQRKLDQSLERLEALKAIERSLGRRGNPARSGEPSVP